MYNEEGIAITHPQIPISYNLMGLGSLQIYSFKTTKCFSYVSVVTKKKPRYYYASRLYLF